MYNFHADSPSWPSATSAHRPRWPQLRILRSRLTAVGLTSAVAVISLGTAVALRSPGASGDSAATTPVMRMAALPLTHRVLGPSTLAGFIITHKPVVVRRPVEWATAIEHSGDPGSEAKRLRRLGYVAGIDEALHGRYPVAAQAVSIVEQYQSSSGARAELAYRYAQARSSARAPGASLTSFRVAVIPGAVAWYASDRHSRSINVAFTDGRFFYLVGAGFPRNAPARPTSRQVIAAANLLYLSLYGCVAPANRR